MKLKLVLISVCNSRRGTVARAPHVQVAETITFMKELIDVELGELLRI